MEANSYFEQHYTLQQATEELESYYAITKQVDGLLITVMHNHLLGDKVLFNGWKEMYESFVRKHFAINV
jgi:nitrogen fixation protein